MLQNRTYPRQTRSSGARRALLGTGAALGAIALALGGATAASAHVSIDSDSTEAGAYTIVSLAVPHGCGASPTTKVAIQMPDGINTVTPTRNPFYTVERVIEQLDTPITGSQGQQITERVSEVVYTATTPLPTDLRDVYQLSLQLPEDAAGTTLYFPVLQTCAEGEYAWIQIPAEGQDSHDLNEPAPGFTVTEASSGDAHGHGAETGSTDAADAGSAASTADQTPLIATSLAIGGLGLVAAVIALLRGRRRT